MQIPRKQLRTEREQLLTLVNQWDPAGVIEAGASRDEYDGLVDRLFDLLDRETRESEIAKFLDREVNEHFGVKPRQTALFATKVLAWFRMRSQP